jgi:hypothetical protein
VSVGIEDIKGIADFEAALSEPLSSLSSDLLLKQKGKVGLIEQFLFTLSVLAFP